MLQSAPMQQARQRSRNDTACYPPGIWSRDRPTVVRYSGAISTATEGVAPIRSDARPADSVRLSTRLRRRLRAIPPTLWFVTALWGALLVGASVLWPMSYGYDEPQHIDMAYVYSVAPFHFYGPGQLRLTLADVGMQHAVPGYPPRKPLSVAPIAARPQRPSFAGLGGHQFEDGGQPNQMVQHPPLYYWMAAAVLRFPGVSSLAWDLQVWLMRLLSVALVLPLPALCWATARRLLISRGRSSAPASRLAVLAAAIPLTVPNLIRDGASVNNDSLLILTSSILLYLLSRVLTGDLSRRTAVWVAVTLAAAMLTKGFALLYPVAVLAAYLFAAWHGADRLAARVRILWPQLAIAAAGGVVGVLWWLRNLIDYHTLQPNGFGANYDIVLFGPPDHRGTLAHFVPKFFSSFIQLIWGGVGLPAPPLAGPLIVYGWLAFVVAGIALALLLGYRPGTRGRAAILLLAPVLTILVVAKGSWGEYKLWSDGVRSSQGRYVYPLMAVLGPLAAIGWISLLRVPLLRTRILLRDLLLPAVIAGAVVTNEVVWELILRSWYVPAKRPFPHGLRAGVDALLRWSPLPVGLTLALVVVIPAVLSVATFIAVANDVRRPALAAE